jgi:hypothetical protein
MLRSYNRVPLLIPDNGNQETGNQKDSAFSMQEGFLFLWRVPPEHDPHQSFSTP